MENTFWSKGYIGQVPLVCQYLKLDGNFVNNKIGPLNHTTSTVLVQFIFFFFISRVTYAILRHLQQNIFAAQIIVRFFPISIILYLFLRSYFKLHDNVTYNCDSH